MTGTSAFRPDDSIFRSLLESGCDSFFEEEEEKEINCKMITGKKQNGSGPLTLQSMSKGTVTSFATSNNDLKKKLKAALSLTNGNGTNSSRSSASKLQNPLWLKKQNKRKKGSHSHGGHDSKRRRKGKSSSSGTGSSSEDEDISYDDEITESEEEDEEGNKWSTRPNTPDSDDEEDWVPEKAETLEEKEKQKYYKKVIPVLSDHEGEDEYQKDGFVVDSSDEEVEESETEIIEEEEEEDELELNGNDDEEEIDSESESEIEDIPKELSLARNRPRRGAVQTVRVQREQGILPDGSILNSNMEVKVFRQEKVSYREWNDEEDEEGHDHQQQQKRTNNNKMDLLLANGDSVDLPDYLQNATTVDEGFSAIESKFKEDFTNVVYVATLRKTNPAKYQFIMKDHSRRDIEKLKQKSPEDAKLIQAYKNWTHMRSHFMRMIIEVLEKEDMQHVCDVIAASSSSDLVWSESLEDHLRKCSKLNDENMIQAVAENNRDRHCYLSESYSNMETTKVIHMRLPTVSLNPNHNPGVPEVREDNIFMVHEKHEAYVVDHWRVIRMFCHMSDFFELWKENVKQKLGKDVDGKKFISVKDGFLVHSLLTEFTNAFSTVAFTYDLPLHPIHYGTYQDLFTLFKSKLKNKKKH